MNKKNFQYDIFVFYSVADAHVVRPLCERLKLDGLNIWFDVWEFRTISSNEHFRRLAIEKGIKSARTLLLCMSQSLFEDEQARAEKYSIAFRDPLDEGRRLIPVLLDDTTTPSWLSSFVFADWRSRSDTVYEQIRDACLPPPATKIATATDAPRIGPVATSSVPILPGKTVRAYSQENGRVLLSTFGGEVFEIDLTAPEEPKHVWKPNGTVTALMSCKAANAIAYCRNGSLAVRAAKSKVLNGHDGPVLTVAQCDDSGFLSGGADGAILLWDYKAFEIRNTYLGHTGAVRCIVASDNIIISGSNDATIRIWDKHSQCLRVLEAHTAEITALALSSNNQVIISGARDNSLRIWEVGSGFCYQALEGHTDFISVISTHPNQRHILTGSGDRTVRLWDLTTGKCLRVLDGHRGDVMLVRWTSNTTAISGDQYGFLKWTFNNIDFAVDPFEADSASLRAGEAQVQYTNAKVLLVGESGAGKSSLSVRLASDHWEPNTESTVGAWATQWKLPVVSDQNIEREIWLWDFGGQSDQRLIHQLYMADAALAILVFNGQKDDLFDSLGQWDRDVCRASPHGFGKILVAARIDAGGLKFSRKQIDEFVAERGFNSYLQTSAKSGTGCLELREAIVKFIDWNRIPWRSSPILFKRLKDKIVELKDAGQILMRFNDLSSRLRLELKSAEANFTDEQLRAVLNLLSGPGIVSELEFGGWILFRPELLNAYGQALIRTIRDDPSELGSIAEDKLLNGELSSDALPNVPKADEQYILLDLHRQLIAKGLCLRQPTAVGNILVLPAFFRRRRPAGDARPPVLVSYEFDGYSDEIHATLVVYLVHTNHFMQDNLWQDGADFVTTRGRKKIGIKLSALREGKGKIDVYANLDVGNGQLIQFIGYVHEHLRHRAANVVRHRHYVCSVCGIPVESHTAVAKRLEMGKDDIVCGVCENRVLLWDELEEIYNDPHSGEKARELEKKITVALDNESKERVLVGEVISAVGLANQLSREKNVSDHGIDMEIEFKNSKGEASGKMIYLQLKSGDSHLRVRKKDSARIFDIKDARHAEYWMNQTNLVYLVIRNSKGEIEWMEIRNHLRELSKDDDRITQIVFKGENFNAQSILRVREHVMGFGTGAR